jgi:hypothetical protein
VSSIGHRINISVLGMCLTALGRRSKPSEVPEVLRTQAEHRHIHYQRTSFPKRSTLVAPLVRLILSKSVTSYKFSRFEMSRIYSSDELLDFHTPNPSVEFE